MTKEKNLGTTGGSLTSKIKTALMASTLMTPIVNAVKSTSNSEKDSDKESNQVAKKQDFIGKQNAQPPAIVIEKNLLKRG